MVLTYEYNYHYSYRTLLINYNDLNIHCDVKVHNDIKHIVSKSNLQCIVLISQLVISDHTFLTLMRKDRITDFFMPNTK